VPVSQPEAGELVSITDLSHDGRGVCRVNGKTVFVHGALPDERVQLRFLQRHRKYDEAEAASVDQASPDRVAPRCEHVDFCGGCALQHLSIEQQRQFKQQQLLENLKRIGQLDVTPEQLAAPLIAAPWGYRRKARLSVRYVHKKQRVLVGFRERKGKFVADCQHCHTLHPAIGERLQQLAELINAMSIRERVPQLEVACGDDSCALIVRHLLPLSDADIALWRDFHSSTGIAIYLQAKGPDSVQRLAPEHHQLAYAIDAGQVSMPFAPTDFVQVNAEINQRMVAQAMDWLALRGDEQVLDLYCGLGNFSLPLARRVAQVTGVEGSQDMVRRAQQNASSNQLHNVSFHMADLSVAPVDLPWQRQHFDAILLDPPRAGAAACVDMLAASAASRILYVSCQPASLARDLGELVNQHGFKLEKIGIMDMFPHTAHVETMALLRRG
jgi:23S rRNA (uracil1939-C5)-methyltransferase